MGSRIGQTKYGSPPAILAALLAMSGCLGGVGAEAGADGGGGAGSGLPLVRSRYTMGTTATVRIEAMDGKAAAGSCAGVQETASALAEGALDRIDEVDRAASLYKPESE